MAQLLPGQVLLADIRTQARQRADQLIQGASTSAVYPDPYANSRITTPELTEYINKSAGELYELLINQWSSYWFFKQWVFKSTVGMSEMYPLPLDQQKFVSIEWRQSPGSNTLNVLLERYNLQERNRYNLNAYSPPVVALGNVAYEVVGQNVWLKPPPQAGLEFIISYVPKPLTLTDTGIITMNGVQTGDQVLVTLDGTSQTIFQALAHGSPQVPPGFVVGGTGADLGDAGTAQSLAACINIFLGGNAGVINAVASPASGATLGTSLVAMSLVGPATITWSTSNNHMVLSPNALVGPDVASGAITWSNIFGAYAGLDEYMVVDAAIKMGVKDKDPLNELMAQKAALVERYKQNYQVRNPGQPRRMTNVRRQQWWGNFGNGGGGFV